MAFLSKITTKQHVNHEAVTDTAELRKHEGLLPVHHVESLQVRQGFADLQAVQEQHRGGQVVLFLQQVIPQLSRGSKESAAYKVQ